MQQLAFARPGRFWKGNLHAHSTRSDGIFGPEEVCRRYREAGYNFLALTDHFLERYGFPLTDTRPMRREGFTTILGAELHAGRTEAGEIWHILAVGLPPDFAPPGPSEDAAGLAARARQSGAYVAVAHPNWYGLSEGDIRALGPVDAVEIYNGVAVEDNDHGESWHVTDVLLGRGERYLACAADDFHGYEAYHDFGRGWVWVKSESLSPESLLDALKAGAYYSSTGPLIHDIHVTRGEQIEVQCSPASYLFVTGLGSKKVRAAGNGRTHFQLSLSGFESPYCRVTVRDALGGSAWSNPIWL